MKNILQEPFEKYLTEKSKTFGGNEFANRFRNQFPSVIDELIIDKNRFKVLASTGKGNWTDCPWIAILDLLITNTPQSGYYPVILFKADMSGAYLSLNQGVTEVKENYKSSAIIVLQLRAKDYRAKLGIEDDKYLTEISLNSKTSNAKHYEAGNIISIYYPAHNVPDSDKLSSDILSFLGYYDQLIYSESSLIEEESKTDFETKQLRLHWRIERNSSLAKKVKKIKGYQCEACGFEFSHKYGDLGDEFIEAHHLKPISELEIGKFKINLEDDFAVLCSNCHRMIHRLPDPSDIDGLKKRIKNCD